MSPYTVLTIHIGTSFNDIARLTIPYMKKYAQKIGVDFNIITDIKQKHPSNDHSAYWAKYQIKDYLDVYDRILYVDLDALIFPHCPNIFDEVERKYLGVLFEDDYGCHHPNEIQAAQRYQKDIGWDKGYFNVGVMVISSEHRNLFDSMGEKKSKFEFPEQTQLNYNARKNSIPLHHLDYKFNHMGFLKGPEINNRFNSYIFHYAATPHEFREHLISDDILKYTQKCDPTSKKEMMEYMYSKIADRKLSEIWQYKLVKDRDLYCQPPTG